MAGKTKAKKAKGEPKTYIAVILDRSGSMQTVKEPTIAGFNEQVEVIQQQADKAGKTFVSLTTFATDVQFPLWKQPAELLTKLTAASYWPNGGTAMNDAIGLTIAKLLEEVEDDEDTAYLVMILTDGEENSSKWYGSAALSRLIASLQKTKRWTFTVAGANIDLAALTRTLSIHAGNSVSFASTYQGTQHVWHLTAASVGDYLVNRGDGIASSTTFYGSKTS